MIPLNIIARLVILSFAVPLIAGCAAFWTVYAHYPGAGYHQWEYASGEMAIYRYGERLRLGWEERKRVFEKKDRGETLTGRQFQLTKYSNRDQVLDWVGEPQHRRKRSSRWGDEEWEYEFCVIYFKKGGVTYLRFKDQTAEPQPIYRWSGRVYRGT